MAGGLTSQPLGPTGGFNWVFLIEILVCGILALFFLFYFNRLFATLISYGIRAWTWHKYRAYIDITSLQISLLGGRVFFKSIRYHAHNITVLVHDGHITWRYWLRLVQNAEVFEVDDGSRTRKQRSTSVSRSEDGGKSGSDDKEKPRSRSIGREERAGGKQKKEFPCRISVRVSGVEAFVYNRSPVYDSILEQTLRKAKSSSTSSGKGHEVPCGSDSPSSFHSNEKGSASVGAGAQRVATDATAGMFSVDHASSREKHAKPELPFFLRIFPIKIECRRAAAAVGNEHTTSVIIAKAEKSVGTIDAGHAGPLDLYKLLFSFDIEKINVAMKPNRDFKKKQLEYAQHLLRERELKPAGSKNIDSRIAREIQMKWRRFTHVFKRARSVSGSLRAASTAPGMVPSAQLQDQVPGQSQWHGLARYLDDAELNEHDEWKDIEYAKASTLADIDSLHMRFYFDVPGKVPDGPIDDETAPGSSNDELNGSEPPEYGLDFTVHGGMVTYGPWADRQRINLQQIFFPASYVDAVPVSPLRTGETRNWSVFKIFILIGKDVTLRIPTREPSKDEKWQGRTDKYKQCDGQDAEDPKRKGRHGKRHRQTRRRKGQQAKAGGDARSYAWMDITVKTDSTVNYTMDMFARSTGYCNKLDVDAKSTEITSSVNHGLLWKTGNVSVDADISQPIEWNTLRYWPFNITIDDMELFIQRDHMFLIIDLVNDWSSGPPPDFFTFVPYYYNLHMLFRNFCIYLNVNDANIINDPANFDKNDFLTLEGTLDSDLGIDMEKYRPVRNMITFDVLSTDMRMRMLSPLRSTLNSLLRDKVVAELPKLTLKGSYSGHIEEREGLTDTLRMDIVGSGLLLKSYGYLVRQLVNVKENYFGDYMHFKTLEEFQDADEDLAVANIKTASIPKPKSVNELDVILCIVAEDATVMLPTSMYYAEKFVCIELPVANLDLRILSYYLDMGLQLSPLSLHSGGSGNDEDDSPVEHASGTQLFVKHVDLDGHRSFGLPPDEPSYANQWDIDVGAITGECSSSFIHDLAMAGRAFAFTFSDRDNALPLSSPSLFYDVTFVQVRTDILRIWLHVGKDAMLISTDPIEISTNDWAGDTFSQRVNVLAPKITFACVDGRSASRHRVPQSRRQGRRTPVRTYAFFQTGVSVNVVIRAMHFAEQRRKQQEHIRINDRRTHRAPFLIHRKPRIAFEDDEVDVIPPAMPYPSLPLPIGRLDRRTSLTSSLISGRDFVGDKQLRPKSSSSSLSNSIRVASTAVLPNMDRLRNQDANDVPSSSPSIRSGSRASSVGSSVFGRRKAPDNTEMAQFGFPPSTMAFSSSFAEPYFPLDLVEPDERDVPGFGLYPNFDNKASETSSTAEMIDNPDFDHEAAQTSVFVNLLPGIRAYFEPRVGITVAKLMRKVFPKSPEETMDWFQMDVLGIIASQQQKSHGVNEMVELQIGLPIASFRIANPASDERAPDQIDVGLRSVETMVRMSQKPTATGTRDLLAVHATVDSIYSTLDRPKLLSDLGPAIKLNINDVLVWVADATSRSVHASVRDTVLSVSGQQVDYLLDLSLRLVPLIEDVISKVQRPILSNRNRVIRMIYTLSQGNEDIGDPAFLSRMTYILRAFPDHFRNQDSWKVLMRFRHILENLPGKLKSELKAKNKTAESGDMLLEVPDKDTENWALWRNWDVPNVAETTAFRAVFDLPGNNVPKPSEQKPLAVTLRSDYLRVALEADGRANEIVLEEISLGLDSTPPTAPTGLMLVEENTRTKTLLQIHATSAALSLDWCAVAIADRVLRCTDKLHELTLLQSNSENQSASKTLGDSLSRHDFHAVVSMDNGSVSLQTINVRQVSRADGMRLSLIGTTQANERYGQCVTALLNADSAVTELHGETRCVWQTLLTSPSIYVDHIHPLPGVGEPPSINLAVAYRDLQVAIQDQIPGLIHLVDLLVLEEVSKIMQVIDSTKVIAAKSSITSQDDKQLIVPQSSSAAKLHVALLAGNLDVEISLLQTLKYKLSGTAASFRVAPSLQEEKAWGIDFDVGHQGHVFVNSSTNEPHEQGILNVPPLNGHIGVQTAPTSTSLSVAATMERVEVDATVIQSVVTVLGRPEVQNVISAINAGGKEVQEHIENLKPTNPTTESLDGSTSKRIVFDVRFALLGIRLAAKTPRRKGQSTAEVEFGIGPLHAVASNKALIEQSQLLLPELRGQIRDIGAKLSFQEKGRYYPCGNVTFGVDFHFKSHMDSGNKLARELKIQSRGLEVNAYPETASTAVDVINHLQDRLKNLDLSKEMDYLRHLRDSRKNSVVHRISGRQVSNNEEEVTFSAKDLLSIKTAVELRDIKISWLVDPSYGHTKHARVADLVLSLEAIDFTTREGHEARLTIRDLQLQLAKRNAPLNRGSLNSALLPEMSFSVAYWSTGKQRSLAFKATGKPLELRLESKVVFPINAVKKSISSAIADFKTGTATWQSTPTTTGAPRAPSFDMKRLASLLVEADFAGAQVYMQGSGPADPTLSALAASSQQYEAQHGRYGQFAPEGALMHTTLTAPGIALKVEYNSNDRKHPTINGELRVDASTNMLLPNVVPLMLEVSNSVKEIVRSQETSTDAKEQLKAELRAAPQRFFEDESIVTADPTAIFGKTKVDLGIRICRQEFGLSCQPIARVDAKAAMEDFYVTMNTIDSDDHGHFFALSAVVTKLNAQVKHVYSREPTFSYDMDSIVLSVLNSKHLSGTSGISAILKINPTRMYINGKQLQDLLLFREVWLPPEIRSPQRTETAQQSSTRSEEYFAQRYQVVAAAAAFPWNATVSIAELAVELDLGQSIGKSSFTISNLWASQAKSSNWEQNLCIGMDDMAMKGTGRMSGFISLGQLSVRTSIKWSDSSTEKRQTPLIQASIGFQRLRAKAAFDYQPFAFGDIEGFDFLMYNVRDDHSMNQDRLVAVLDCEKAYVFCTSTSPAQALGLYQAFDRLIKEKQTAFTQSLKDLEKHLRRESTVVANRIGEQITDWPVAERPRSKDTISLHTDVVVSMGTISFGVFPSTFFDSQILKLEANSIQARFAAGLEGGRILSALGMTLGQLQVALASVRRVTAVPKALDVNVDDVVSSAVNAKGGIILRVPKVVASMQTWQAPRANTVDYIFKSLFAGKIDVGWNLARINFIKNMWNQHSRSLASRLGKSLPESAVKITAGPVTGDDEADKAGGKSSTQEKITAEVNLPQSRYEYNALETPIIETPQLRDMGEATPPLEWIGLHRDRLPNVTHQIIIVSLLEVAKEVEEAYEKILGSS